MKIFRYCSYVAAAVVIASILGGCPSTTTTPPEDTVVVQSNLQPDSTVGWLYYSLDNDSIVDPSLGASAEWDVRMAYLRCCGQTKQIDVFLNSGTAGSGMVQGAMVASRFENLAAVPSGTTLRNDDTSAASRIVPVAVIGSDVMFVYDMSTHTLRPSPDRCLVIKTGKGNTYKFQFTSIYKDADPAPTVNSPLGFYFFRFKKL